jgi:glutamine amidotransferase
MLALVDYGIGNLRSVGKALSAVGAEVKLTSDPEVVLEANKVVLPGVGAFRDGMRGLRERNLIEPLLSLVSSGTPFLGICVGMQLLFQEGEEHGIHKGLGLLPGTVKRFEVLDLIVPHTGWNKILPTKGSKLLQGVEPGAYAYFNHSYYCDASPEDTLAYTEYGVRYSSMIERGSIYGAQFHPEKSQQVGLTILRNFVERC